MSTAQHEKKSKTQPTGKKPMKRDTYSNTPMGGLRNILISASKPNLHKWTKDGGDHINLGAGTSPLGSKLSFSGISPFKHSRLGRFKTLFGFWNYLANEEQDDRYRVLNDKEIRAFNRQRDIKRTPRRVRNFIAIVLDAQWQRVKNNERLLKELKESTLPFDCYKVNGDVRERTSYEYWFVPAMEAMRKCIKEGTEFDITPYMQDRNADLFADLIANPVIAGVSDVEEIDPPKNEVVPKVTGSLTLKLDSHPEGHVSRTATWEVDNLNSMHLDKEKDYVTLSIDGVRICQEDDVLACFATPNTLHPLDTSSQCRLVSFVTGLDLVYVTVPEPGIIEFRLSDTGAALTYPTTSFHIDYTLSFKEDVETKDSLDESLDEEVEVA